MAEESFLRYIEEFAQLAEELLAEHHDEERTLDRIVSLAVETIDSCEACSVTLLRRSNGQMTTAASTAPIATQAAGLQQQLGEGPFLDVAWSLETLSIDNLATDHRWSSWSQAALQLGISSMLGLRLDIQDPSQVAALNLFAKQPDAFDATDLAIASVFSRHAGAALAAARTEDRLRTAAKSRQTIGVAQGMLMQRFGLTLDQSFELLRRYSQTHNIKLRTLAERLQQSGGITTTDDDDAPGSGLEETLGLR